LKPNRHRLSIEILSLPFPGTVIVVRQRGKCARRWRSGGRIRRGGDISRRSELLLSFFLSFLFLFVCLFGRFSWRALGNFGGGVFFLEGGSFDGVRWSFDLSIPPLPGSKDNAPKSSLLFCAATRFSFKSNH